jgi:hypothetical protein
MKMDRVKAFEKLLIENIELFLSQGGVIIFGSFGIDPKYACPISTIGLNSGTYLGTADLPEFIASKFELNISYQEIWSFIIGFDGKNHREQNQFFDLGMKLREKYSPIVV